MAIINPDDCQNDLCSNVLGLCPNEMDCIQVYLWNARNIVNKLSDFSSFVYASNYNVYGITESWLSDHIYDNEILLSDYVIYRKD